MPDRSSIQTRPTLLQSLKTGAVDGWNDFYLIYGALLRNFAMQAGLTATEADEVVQETAIAVARHLPEFNYDPKVCRFKTWLLNQASWRIKDQIKKNNRHARHLATPEAHDSARTSTTHRIADPAAIDLDSLFEAEWRKGLFDAAMLRVKEEFNDRQFQIFDLLVNKEWPAAEVARLLGVSVANIYVIRHRVSAAIKKEIKRLERQLEEAAQRQADPSQHLSPAPKN
ncbi:MAG TPA: sigma-70 family RNA polymerase sigma factor [Verrucomicrobiae bacterium]|jgi:RNA polymerase sigma-70 factor (ECF subfamily)|nr:sigma-70 family RNA polymerase sigma factor [Verrucomicrobiae bacterium]